MMLALVICGGLFLAAAIFLRELQMAKERALHIQALEQLRRVVEETRGQLRRTREDLYVLHATLAERNVISPEELSRRRAELIENPRRVAEGREEIVRTLGADAEQVVDEGDSVH